MNITGWPGPVLHLNSVDSTQNLARRMAEDGEPEWSLVIADRQTQGRGRMSNKWNSAQGGLYFSLILRPKIRPDQLAKISIDTADVIAKTLTAATGLRTAVKPPNDILATPHTNPLPFQGRGKKTASIRDSKFANSFIQLRTNTIGRRYRSDRDPPHEAVGRQGERGECSRWYKVCGILTEASGGSDHIDWIVIGIGINVNNRIPSRLPLASSLAQLAGRDLDLRKMRQKVLTKLRQEYSKALPVGPCFLYNLPTES